MSKVSAGSYDLNKWLFGGYESDILNVIYGSSGTGKTNFCLLAAVSQAKKGNKVIFIDTEGGFSVERVKQIFENSNGSELSYEDVLKNIILLKVTSFNEQKEAFKKLNQYLKDEISLLIVDGMTMLYRLDFASAKEKDDFEMKKVNNQLVEQVSILAEIARKKGIPIIVTNQVYNWDGEKKMVGGDILKYWGKCLIELTNENGKRTAFLKKHRSLPEKELDFYISNSGIKKKGWI